ncbi:uncharacterized protein LOC119078719 [Bradysia coprophila]|uniref:uncharacterized protein LOC119078719 n=1 Tax=Bradysia coprophila TaxID=38358 RepID=UPI00187D8443|nr:uncharacterized protein LOC119078719 [Bradysia coprophila]
MGNILQTSNDDIRKKYECEVYVNNYEALVIMAEDLTQLRRLLSRFDCFKQDEDMPFILDSKRRKVLDNTTFVSLENRIFYAISSKPPADGTALEHQHVTDFYKQFETRSKAENTSSFLKFASRTLPMQRNNIHKQHFD